MTEMENAKEKIKKLLSLANSDNENEAMLAMKKAQELMAKHKLEKAEIEKDEMDIVHVTTDFWFSRLKKYWMSYLIHAIAENFCVKDYVKIYPKSSRKRICLVGREEDISVCMDVFIYAADHIEKWFKEYKRKEGWKFSAKYLNAIENSYGRGFASGLNELLERQREEKLQEWGLVMVAPEEAKNFVETLPADRRKAKANFSEEYEIESRGYFDGRTLEMNSVLTEGGGSHV